MHNPTHSFKGCNKIYLNPGYWVFTEQSKDQKYNWLIREKEIFTESEIYKQNSFLGVSFILQMRNG